MTSLMGRPVLSHDRRKIMEQTPEIIFMERILWNQVTIMAALLQGFGTRIHIGPLEASINETEKTLRGDYDVG